MTETISSTPTKSLAGAGSEILPPSGDAAPPPSGKPDRVTAVSNLALGSLLLALEALDDWVDHNVPTQAQALEQRAQGQGVLLPQSEWEATYGRPEADRMRLAAMGMAASANSRAVRATRFALADRRTGSGRRALAAGPHLPVQPAALWDRSRGGGPEPADRPVGRGGKGAGHREPRRRRVSLGRAAQDSVEIVTVEPHVQVLVQEIVAAQGTGITKEIIKEVREHAVSLDHGHRQGVGDLARAAQTQHSRRPISPWLSRARSPIRRRWPAGLTSAAGTRGSRAGCWPFRSTCSC